jgi:TolB-like protein
VLPFTSNGSAGDAKNGDASAAIASLITDELTTTLSSAGGIRVISRETATTFHSRTVDAARVGAELGVAYLLEGSTSMRGDSLRVNIGLVETATGIRVWSRRFERSGPDRLAIQDEIINGLCRELQIEVTRIAGETGSRAADVHSAVLQGWSKIYASGVAGKPALEDAEKLFSGALDRDPGNVRAQLGLAGYHVTMALQLFAPDPSVHLAKAEALLHALIERRTWPRPIRWWGSPTLPADVCRMPGAPSSGPSRSAPATLPPMPSSDGYYCALGGLTRRWRTSTTPSG